MVAIFFLKNMHILKMYSHRVTIGSGHTFPRILTWDGFRKKIASLFILFTMFLNNLFSRYVLLKEFH